MMVASVTLISMRFRSVRDRNMNKNDIIKKIQYWYIESIINNRSYYLVYTEDILRVFEYIPKNTKSVIEINKRFLLDDIINYTIRYIYGA